MTDGGPAFPSSYVEKDPNYPPEQVFLPGMMLRDYFAGQALPPCVSAVIAIEAAGTPLKKDAPVCAAEMAYQIADAMLVARCPQESGRD